MARADMAGFFWNDTPEPKAPPKEKPKRLAPERTWELDSYLPGLDEARRFPVQLMTDGEILQAAWAKEPVVCDVECYSNYFLVAFMSVVSDKVFYLEAHEGSPLDCAKLRWLLENFCLITFNGRNYDLPILALAVAGRSNEDLKLATNQIIVEGVRPGDILRGRKVKALKVDHIDLKELAPLNLSLKMCAGRLHAHKMQDLPFHPDKVLGWDQIAITRYYCVNDLRSTKLLYAAVLEEIDLRVEMGKKYNVDLRSKSDAQIAETVIAQEVQKLNGYRAQHPTIPPGTVYRFKPPAFLKFQSTLMQWVLDRVNATDFVVGEDGKVMKPPELAGLKFQIGGGTYSMGIGGLHSTEKTIAHVCDGTFVLCDIDVASNYPRMILNQRLYPSQLGPNFLVVYNGIVETRLKAKLQKNKLVADTLKIVINGSYGKLGSMFSIMYAPDLLFQVTITGQLALLMLIERLELVGIPVVSANTDGIVVKCPTAQQEKMAAIVKQWERDCDFETEETGYKLLASRDVNNYIAIKPDGSIKSKGVYAKMSLDKNCRGQITVDAVFALLTSGTPVQQTIQRCTDITRFVFILTVNGGAVQVTTMGTQYLGKAVRWYYGKDVEGEFVRAVNGNKVPSTEGAVPVLELPAVFPSNIDYDWYEREANKMLEAIGYYAKSADAK